MRFAWFGLLVFGCGLMLSPGIGAQTVAMPSVAPDACTIAPAESPLPGYEGDLNAPSPTPTPLPTLVTDPADAETAATIIERIAMSIACENAGDLPRMLGNFSPSWIAVRFSGYDLVFAQRYMEAAASPQPLDDEDLIELVAVTDITVSPDGIAFATVTTVRNGIEHVDMLILVSNDGGWLIDGAQAVVTD